MSVSSENNNSSVNLDSVRLLLNEKTAILKNGALAESNFSSDWGDSPEVSGLYQSAVRAKRSGDLISANNDYCECLRKFETFNSCFVWAWCKVMILAKNWECLCDLVRYHFDVMVAWNRLMRDKKNQAFFDNYARLNMIPYFKFEDFHAGEHLRDQVHSPLVERESSIARLAEFGGSPYWTANYTISESEWREFMHVFPVPQF